MKKTDKKLEKALRQALTDACEIALERVPGFRWLTHEVDYRRFPDSLSIVCVFNTNLELSNAIRGNHDAFLREVIREQLAAKNIQLRQPQQQVNFDTEEECDRLDGGDWRQRLRHHRPQ